MALELCFVPTKFCRWKYDQVNDFAYILHDTQISCLFCSQLLLNGLKLVVWRWTLVPGGYYSY